MPKLHIEPVQPSNLEAFDVQFNPTSYSITKSVSWTSQANASGLGGSASNKNDTNRALDAPPLEFGGGGARTLSLQLFFDVTEGPESDVRKRTDRLVALSRIDRDQKRPPVCKISWGGSSKDFPFVCVLTSLTQNFVLFSAEGVPLRANVTAVFTEMVDETRNQKETDPDFTTYLVKLGDNLSNVAGRVYGDPTLWRVIAAANRIDDPRRLAVGSRLAIPKVG